MSSIPWPDLSPHMALPTPGLTPRWRRNSPFGLLTESTASLPALQAPLVSNAVGLQPGNIPRLQDSDSFDEIDFSQLIVQRSNPLVNRLDDRHEGLRRTTVAGFCCCAVTAGFLWACGLNVADPSSGGSRSKSGALLFLGTVSAMTGIYFVLKRINTDRGR
eukprot:SAG11_NODE_1719_length_4381_cov_8.257823_5_plen_161_part_00